MPGTTTSSDTGLRPARPTIVVAGQDRPDLAEGLISLLVAETVDGLYRCEATFGNWGTVNNTLDFLYFDRAVLDFGKTLAVRLGAATLFDGRIMALEAGFPEGQPPTLAVLAEDRFQDLRMTRRTRTFADVSDADVASQLASEHGLSASVDVPGPAHRVLAQVNQSDLAFLRERARATDAELWLDGSALHLQTRASRQGGAVQLTHGRELHEFSVLADLAHQRTGVAVTGWDVAGKTGLRYEATDSVIQGELGSDVSGASTLAASAGARKDALVHTVPLTSQEAQAEAEAYFKLAARRFLVGHGVAEADGALRAGASVDLRGLGPLFSGKYYLTEVRTRFDGTTGIRAEFTAERPGLGRGK